MKKVSDIDAGLREPDARPNTKPSFDRKQFVIWLCVLVAGAGLGMLRIDAVDNMANVVARIYTRLFQMLAVPTIALAVITTLASFGKDRTMGRIFSRALLYTLTTTFMAALTGLVYYLLIKPQNLPEAILGTSAGAVPEHMADFSLSDHFMSVIPDNILRPVLEGNVLSLMLIAFAVGLAIAKMPQSEGKSTLTGCLLAAQEVLFILIRWLIWTLPLGILAFSEQLTAQMSSGQVIDSLGAYIAVILCSNCTQIFIILPLFLLSRGLNPFKVFKQMLPAVLMALFTKSSAATLPLTMQNAEERVGVNPKVSRFVLPLCTTINMNGQRGVYIRHIPVCHAERRYAYNRFHIPDMASCGCICCCRQCRGTDGLLLPDPLADDRDWCPGGSNGIDTAGIYDNRYGRDCRECLVRLLCLHYDRTRPRQEGCLRFPFITLHLFITLHRKAMFLHSARPLWRSLNREYW